VIEAIWPESEPQLGNASLRMALTHVRKALNLNQHPDDSLILKRGMIYFNPQIELYGDYELFTEIAQGISEKDDSGQETLNLIEQAVKLYRGDFLPDNLYDDWTANLRKQLYRLYLQVLVKQADACRRRGKLDAAIKAGRRCLELEPADELLNRMAMELLWQSGQKHQALSLYNDLAAFLAREFDTTPSAETIALYEKIRCS
jgi:DNA-binding SARP family transcriptional activator